MDTSLKGTLRTPILLVGMAALALMLFGATRGSALAQSFEPTFEPAPCMFAGVDLGLSELDGEGLGFECGYVTVPVRHENPDGETLRLPVAIHRATAANAQPDPVFLAQGGPGGDAFGVFTLLTPNNPIAIDRDLVIFNQRGTEYSEPDLSCSETFDVLPEVLATEGDEGDQLYEQALSACYDRLVSEGIDVSAFNSLQNAADVESIREALGYDEYNFYGVSYGTLLGLHLMREHPEGLRSVILDSVAPTDINFIEEVASSENRVYDEVFAYCEEDPSCREAYPNLEQRYFNLIDQLNESPTTITITDSETGESYDALVDGTTLRSIMYQLLYVARMYAVFPKIVSDMESGDFSYVEAMWPLFVFDQSVSEGMYYSVICAEDADFDPALLSLDGLRPVIAETAREDLQSYLDACRLWPVDLLPDEVDDPVSSDIPTLLLSGRFDPITPPAFAQAAAVDLTHAYTVLDPTASHGVAFQSDCINVIMQSFLDDPSTTPDTGCIAGVSPVDALPPDAITLPMMAAVNNLDTGFIASAGIGGLLLLIVLSAFVIWPLVLIIRAIRNTRQEYSVDSRRLRWISRILVLVFGALTFVFAAGLMGFIGSALFDLTYATALSIPGSAAPILWIPFFLLLLGIAIVISAVLVWVRPDTGSTAGKIYYTILAICVVGILILIAQQDLLFPPI
ncbi:MAG: alpha/beta fold hydrolase [Chloroflexota bacterium]